MSARPASRRYVLCVSNARYRASLITRRLYPVLPDVAAEDRGLVRVIDESGEDYLFPKALFLDIDLPARARRLLAKPTPKRGARRPSA